MPQVHLPCLDWLGFSRCGCPLVAAAFPRSKCRKSGRLTGLCILCVQPSSEREALTLAALFFFLPKYLSPETLLTAKAIYHSLFAFSFPRHLDLNSHLVMAQRLSSAPHICGSSSQALSTANQTSLIWVVCMHLKFRNIKSN